MKGAQLAALISELVELEIAIAKQRARADALRTELGLDRPRMGRPPSAWTGQKRQLSAAAREAMAEAGRRSAAKRKNNMSPEGRAALQAGAAKARAIRWAKREEPKKKKRMTLTPKFMRALRANAAKARAALAAKHAAAAEKPKKKPTAAQLAAYRANAAKGRAAQLARLAQTA